MEFSHNAYWCSDLIWGGDYDCEYIVSIDKFVGEVNDKKEKMQHSDIKKITENFVAFLDAKSKLKISEKYLSFSEI